MKRRIDDDSCACANCWHWHQREGAQSADEGECRLNPPRVFMRPIDGIFVSAWPPTDAHDWCAKFEFEPDSPEHHHQLYKRT